jgi:hypothetical protein
MIDKHPFKKLKWQKRAIEGTNEKRGGVFFV